MHYKSIYLILLFTCLFWYENSVSEIKNNAQTSLDYSINRYQKDFDLGFKRGTIRIINHFGDVHLKNTNAHQVGISVIAQELGENPAIHDLLVKNNEKILDITVQYESKDLKNHKNKSVKWPIGRVDLVVFVPIEMTVDIETIDGAIDVRKTKNWIKAKSQTGKIDISNHYDIEAFSESGRIKVFPMSTKWQKGVNLQTKSAPIYAVIPKGAEVNLNTKTSGVLNSRLNSPESWIKIDSDIYNAQLTNYQIKSQSGDIYISPHQQLQKY